MAHVFLSHASEDLKVALELHRWLRSRGHDVFLDHDIDNGIRGGEDWQRRLLEELYRAEVVFCLVSRHFTRSHWCTAEVAIAHTLGKRIVPIALGRSDSRSLPMIGRTQFIEWGDQSNSHKQIDTILHEVDFGSVDVPVTAESPFPGLLPYEYKLAWAYAGREREVTELADIIRSPAVSIERQIVVIVGPSGCGKSSLVRAGVGPELAKDPNWWVLPATTPGDDPILSLATSLANGGQSLGLDWTPSVLRARLSGGRGISEDDEANGPAPALLELIEEMQLASRVAGRQVLLIIDQLEEIFTRASPNMRSRFVDLISGALAGRVGVLATLRSEFLPVYQKSGDIGQISLRSYLLAPLSDHMLRTVIETPAKRAGIRMGRDLVDALVSETGHGDALPLLAFTLNQLAEGLSRGQSLSLERYTRLGGVTRAMQIQADMALRSRLDAGRTHKEVMASLLLLVAMDKDGVPARKRVVKSALTPDSESDLDAFVGRRLLMTEEIGSQPFVAVSHERFITDWAPLADAVADEATVLRTLGQLEQAATEWENASRPVSHLWSLGRLGLAFPDQRLKWKTISTLGSILDKEYAFPLGPDTRSFIVASMRKARQRTLAAIAAMLLFTTTLSVATLVAVNGSAEAYRQRLLAAARGIVDRADSVRDSDPLLAMRLGLAANTLSPTKETRSSLLETLVKTRLVGGTTSNMRTVKSMSLSNDDSMLAVSDGNSVVDLWLLNDTGVLKKYRSLPTEAIAVNALAFTPEGRYLIGGLADGSIIVWDVQTGGGPKQVADRPSAHSGSITAMALSLDGQLLVTAGSDRTIQLWSMEFPAKPALIGNPLMGQLGPITSVAVSRNSQIVATGSADSTFVLWDIRDRQSPKVLVKRGGVSPSPVKAMQFSSDDQRLAVAADRVSLWELRDPAHPRLSPHQITSQSGQITTLAFARKGGLLASGSRGNAVELWDPADQDAATNAKVRLNGHVEPINALAFDSRGRFLLSGSQDGRVFVWDLQMPDLMSRLKSAEISATPLAVASHPQQEIAAVGDDSGTVRLWSLQDGSLAIPIGPALRGHEGRITSLAFSPDGHLLATASYDQTVRLWDVTDPGLARLLGDPLRGHQGRVTALSFSPDGRSLATGGYDRSIRLWSIDESKGGHPLGTPLVSHNNTVTSLVFISDSHLASAGLDGAMIVWDVRAPPAQMAGFVMTNNQTPIHSLARSPEEDAVLGSTTDGTILIWDVSSPSRPRQISELRSPEDGAVVSLDMSPKSTEFIAVTTSGHFLIGEAGNTNFPRRLGDPIPVSDGTVAGLAIDRTGLLLITANTSGSVDIWSLAGLRSYETSLIEQACRRSGGGLSEIEWERYVPSAPYRVTCGPYR
ncbi:nSTAND1 domain-containing NTPase [Nonomuraea wenchangensis]|uniref:nSTAND1 domain-containing NTPase n=1 Tax=Nonomuraea wenchangensis TaxID=568860 RepID=UPI00378AF0E9